MRRWRPFALARVGHVKGIFLVMGNPIFLLLLPKTDQTIIQLPVFTKANWKFNLSKVFGFPEIVLASRSADFAKRGRLFRVESFYTYLLAENIPRLVESRQSLQIEVQSYPHDSDRSSHQEGDRLILRRIF